jgi:putative RecB family exonuclease
VEVVRDEDGTGGDGSVHRPPALSPSRASDFRRCPLLYRFRAIDRLPEPPGRAQVRGTLVHAVLERLYAMPAAERSPAAAHALLGPAWDDLLAVEPGLPDALFDGAADPDLAVWLDSASALLDTYFTLEDPRAVVPAAVEERVEVVLESALLPGGLPLRGFVDRLDHLGTGGTGGVRVVDYKTGSSPGEFHELGALFQLKFYALAVLAVRGVVPAELRLLYLSDGQVLRYTPDAEELGRFTRLLEAIWAAVLRAGETGDFRPNPGSACRSCAFTALCPAWDGTPPPYPGWPSPLARAEA